MRDTQVLKDQIPPKIYQVAHTLVEAGFEAYFVGGCVRDLLLHKKPKDWDITTNAVPEEIIKLFPHTFYENDFGTVGVVLDELKAESEKNENAGKDREEVVEITPYRLETGYSDMRRPDTVSFSTKLEDDLKRRDFTINAIALDTKGHTIDLYKGHDDLEQGVLRAVGNPKDRFLEDALRILRAVRLSCELDFAIEPETEQGITATADQLAHISKERVRDEFIRIVMSDNPKKGLELAKKYNLLHYISPELGEGIGVEQGGAHSYDVWEHLLRALQHAADKKWSLEIRLAALFHDIAKPRTRSKQAGKEKWSFYGHEVVGAKMTKKILSDLKFPKQVIEKVTKLTRWHMFFADTEAITHSAVRRLVANVGKENVWDLMSLRAADRIGTGRPKESPYRLRKYHAMIEEVMRDPVSVGMLKIDGKGIMEATDTKPGPKIGFILHALLEEVLENPSLNTEEYLQKRAQELITLSETDLKKLGEKGKESKEKEEQKEVEEIRKRHFVE